MTENTTTAASGAASRTPTDYALEFAEYLARGAEHLIEAVCADAKVRLRIAESDDVDDDTEHDAQASVDEALRSLRDRIGEFRSRRDRAARAALAAPAAQGAEPAWLAEVTGRLQSLAALKKRSDSMPVMHEIQWLISLRNRMVAAPRPQADAGAVPADVHAALCDSQYAAGMLLGWNLCVEGNHEQFRKARGARMAGACEVVRAQSAAAPQAPAALTRDSGITLGHAEADRVLRRLDSSDPDFNDCAAAAALIIKLVEECRGPAGFATWKDAAIAERTRANKAESLAQAPAAGAAPTDAEIGQLFADETGFLMEQQPAAIASFARAVLARWGAAAPAQEAEDAALLDFIGKNSLDLRCFDMPTGQGDADIGWRIVQHHVDAPHERVASEVYSDDPRKAVREAMVRLARDPYCRGELHPDTAARARQEGQA